MELSGFDNDYDIYQWIIFQTLSNYQCTYSPSPSRYIPTLIILQKNYVHHFLYSPVEEALNNICTTDLSYYYKSGL